MCITFTHEVDKANKLLICEVKGLVETSLDAEHLLKNVVKLAGKGQVKNVVVDVTELSIGYSSMHMANLMLTMQNEGWLVDIKIARIVEPKDNAQNLVGEMAEKYNLPIKNFDNRSDALIWLLFNK
ncbi:hypothetical protein [Paraglaciecola hydrolytica]|uniref:STAS domain-containing protein n=1 Tax=Paraglaciecola hydrolytica TaxID=1799789 RepID=A0A136A0F5_9ALTE|nr:hypothetical protein [Paraglaciecola hydrolytica]KXI28673.1 hypothetical protein AX660_16490 [Paraglaciecola hydrolytica]